MKTVPPPPPLHQSIGVQLLFLDGVRIPNERTPRLIEFSREALEKVWRILHELNEVASNPEKYPPIDDEPLVDHHTPGTRARGECGK